MREKLIELEKNCCEVGKKCGASCFACMADHLIANGVTISKIETVAKDNDVPIKWIPVTERLPELHTKVLCCGKKGGRFIAELSTWGKEKHLCWDKRNGQGCPTVTHWMPLPEPPKGE